LSKEENMADFEMYFSDKEREEAKKKASITPLVCGTPTEQEAEEAFEKLFEDIWRKNR
jgi:hypothetical protein